MSLKARHCIDIGLYNKGTSHLNSGTTNGGLKVNRLQDFREPFTPPCFCARIAAMNEKGKQALQAFSHGDMSAIELRRRLGGATYGEVLRLLSEENLPLPSAPTAGREEQLERARAWMFPKNVP
jgi:hypothetical protein